MGVLMSGNPDPMASKLQLETVRSLTDSPPNWNASVRVRERRSKLRLLRLLRLLSSDIHRGRFFL
jgi:hypothetical protein